MRIVIIGATGNIGTALVDQLSNDHELRLAARRQNVATATEHGTHDAWALDVAKDDLSGLLADAEAVVHLAWLFQPSHRPDITWRNNVIGTSRLLEAAAVAGVPRVVVSSSIAAYSPVPDHRVVDEAAPTHGASDAAYAREKAYVERMLDAFEASHPRVRVARVRPAFVFQRASASQQRRLFAGPLIPGTLLKPGRLPVLPVPEGLRLQAIHASDVAAAIARILEQDEKGAFNLAADGSLDSAALARIFEARPFSVTPRLMRTALAVGWHTRLVPAPPALFDALMALPTMDTSRAKDKLQWGPQVSATDALTEVLTGFAGGAGGPTKPLEPGGRGTARWREFASGAGQRQHPS
jgi:UDP-glucose 4-epimerase